MAVVPTTRLQSRIAPSTVLCSSALANSEAAPTAETASRNAFSYGVTTRNWYAPKLLMARAAAPILSGLRVRTSTMRRFSSLLGGVKALPLYVSFHERNITTTDFVSLGEHSR